MQGDDAQHLYKTCNLPQQRFHRLMSRVLSPVWMQVSHLQLLGGAELAVTVTTSEVCHAATPPK